MGSYRCTLRDKLRPKTHEAWHGDLCSYKCPIIRDETTKAAINENYNRLKRLLKMAEENNWGYTS